MPAKNVSKLAGLFLVTIAGWSILTPMVIAGNLPPANDIPEEILRAEIILEARSPIDGKALSASDFAELLVQVEQQLSRDEAAAATKNSAFKNVLFLLRLRGFFKSLGIPIK